MLWLVLDCSSAPGWCGAGKNAEGRAEDKAYYERTTTLFTFARSIFSGSLVSNA